MSVVLQFPVNRIAPREAVAAGHNADVVIFPGVQMERRNFEAAEPRIAPRKRRISQAAIDEDMA